MKIGIEKIGFYTPGYQVDMVELAKARKIDPDKFTIGIGQDQMSVAPVWEDAVTMAANASEQILTAADKASLGELIVGSETGVDQSKASALYVSGLLGVSKQVRAFDIKEACYGATAALQMALSFVKQQPTQKVLVIGSDIARYGLATPGEVTQGAGAVSLLISATPKILAIDPETAFQTEDLQDFWRPNYSRYAFADGKFSNDTYIRFFQETWSTYSNLTKKKLSDFAALVFHLPYSKMGMKALRPVLPAGTAADEDRLTKAYALSTQYSRRVGNIYTGSLYMSLLALLSSKADYQTGERIGLFSYGSGAVGEFFSGQIQAGYQAQLSIEAHQAMLNNRQKLSVNEYEKLFLAQLPTDGSLYDTQPGKQGKYYLAGIIGDARQYRVSNVD